MARKQLEGQNKVNTIKLIGLSVLFIPLTFLLIFIIGESGGGDISGITHLFQMAPIILLGALGTKYPYFIGNLLILLGVIFITTYSLYSKSLLLTTILVDTILFVPLIISGIFLVMSIKIKSLKK